MRRSVISLFTGAGGLDIGLEAAGFETSVAVEMDESCVGTLRANRSWPVLHRSIHDVTSEELLDRGGMQVGEASLLAGGPPCQPFSKSGYWATGDTKRLDDPRASTLDAYLRVLRDTLPQAFLLENVAGLAYRGKDEGLNYLAKAVDAINAEMGTHYSFNVLRLNAANYGVPQSRERIVIVGSRDGRSIRVPEHTHGDCEIEGRQRALPLMEPFRTAWDAIGDLEGDDDPELAVGGKWADLLPSIPEGGNYLYHTDRGGGLPLFGWRRRYWAFLLKLARDKPSWTITAQPGSATGPFHWKNRKLSARELCRLQTIPDSYVVLGTPGAVQRQVGNAVPSALAEVIGLRIRAEVFGERIASTLPTLVPPRRVPPESVPLPLARVPGKFLALVGDHSAHPGTGRGFAAESKRAS